MGLADDRDRIVRTDVSLVICKQPRGRLQRVYDVDNVLAVCPSNASYSRILSGFPDIPTLADGADSGRDSSPYIAVVATS